MKERVKRLIQQNKRFRLEGKTCSIEFHFGRTVVFRTPEFTRVWGIEDAELWRSPEWSDLSRGKLTLL